MKSILIGWSLLFSVFVFGQEVPCTPIADDCDLVDWTLGINIDYNQTVQTGDNFCVPFTVTDFTNILAVQFTITYDPYVLAVDCDNIVVGNCLNGVSASNFNCPTNTSNGCNTTITGSGDISFVWFNPNAEGICCNDGSTMFEICFTAIGEALDATSIILSDNITNKEVVVGFDITSVVNCPIPCDVDPGQVDIECTDLSAIVTSSCGNTDGMDDGSFCFEVCGGTPPYNYTVTEAPSTIVYTGTVMDNDSIVCYDNLPVGTYIIGISDGAGATNAFAAIIDILPAVPITYEIDSLLPSCWDRENGSIEITNIEGGTPDYCYNWSNGTSMWSGTSIIDDLPSGTYFVTIEDAAGCQVFDTIHLSLDTLQIHYEIVETAVCTGSPTGKIKVWASGGIPFHMDPMMMDSLYEINDSTARDTLYICDIIGGDCIDLQAFDNSWIPCGSEIVEFCMPVSSSFTPEITINNPQSCFGVCDGFVQVMMPGATKVSSTLYDDMGIAIPSCFPGCPFIIYGSFNNTTEIQNLCAGDYTLEVFIDEPIEFSGCMGVIDFTVTEPDTLVLSCNINEPTCTGLLGEIDLCNTQGGTPPFTYKWSDGFTGCQRDMLTGGIFEVTVCDVNGCTDTKIIDMPEAGSLDITIDTISLVSCDVTANDGALEVIINSMGSQFTIEWKDDMNMIIGDQAILPNIGPGTYFVRVVDDLLGCEAFAIATLEAPPSVTFDVNLNIPDCYGSATGGIGITVLTGEEPYEYQWDSSPIDASVLQPIAAGTYCVTVFDAVGCSLDSCIVLTNPDSISLEIINVSDALCFNQSNGSITVLASGGTVGAAMFNYFVYNDMGIEVANMTGGQVDINNLAPACYTLIATDGTCASPTPIPFCIGAPDPITIGMSTLTEPSCFEACDGSISVTGIGGDGNFTYQWVGSPNPGQLLTDACAGWHFVSIMDGSGCTNVDSVFLTEPDSLSLELSAITEELSCFTPLGRIGVTAIGGTEDYSYTWSGNESNTNIAENLGAGTYSITVTDANLCTAEITHTLDAPSEMTMELEEPDAIPCFGDVTCIKIADVIGGIGDPDNYTFNIVLMGPQISIDSCFVVNAGEYKVTVFDSLGCSVSTDITINQPDQITVDLGPDVLEVELGDSTVIIQADISPNLPIDTIIWTPFENMDCKDPLCQIVSVYPTQNTIYEIIVIDENGCTATDQIEILIDDNRSVYIPTAFSPNDDGTNDNFNIFVGNGVEAIEYFAIFDRWGERIFVEESYNANESALIGWDGKFRGRDLNPGVYAYIVKVQFIDGREITYKGPITLLR